MNKPCDECDDEAVFSIFAVGYLAAMHIACPEHVGPFLARDLNHPGSTAEWMVRPCSWLEGEAAP